MSIIIKGMDMPKNEELWIRVQPDGNIVSQTGYVIEDASAKQVTPHGRLIDADALICTMIETLESLKKNPKMDREEAHLIAAFHAIGEMVKDMPTIIEAEEEK